MKTLMNSHLADSNFLKKYTNNIIILLSCYLRCRQSVRAATGENFGKLWATLNVGVNSLYSEISSSNQLIRIEFSDIYVGRLFGSAVITNQQNFS